MADGDERFRLQMRWLRDEEGNLITDTLYGSDNDPEDREDIDGIIYFSDLEMGSPYDAIMVHAADDVHESKLHRIELTFEDVWIALERTEEPATIGDRAEEERKESMKAAPPADAERILQWH